MSKDYLADDHISGDGYLKYEHHYLAARLRAEEKEYKEHMEKTNEKKDLSIEHLTKILSEVVDQITHGKGQERHGSGIPFQDQPWKHILDNVGDGFSTGQALKKIFELKSLTSLPAYKREVLGAIAYLCMSLMYKEYLDESSRT